MIKKLFISITIAATLAGCASSPSYTSVYDQIMIGNKQTPEDYSYIDDKSLSQEMQFMYYIGNSDVKPIKANDLDNFAKDYNPHSVSDASLVGASVITLLGGANIFQLGTFGLGNLGGRVDMNNQYKENKIIVLVPTANLTNDQIKAKVAASVAKTTSAVKKAIEDDGRKFIEDKYLSDDKTLSEAYFLSYDKDNDVPDCAIRGEVNSLGRVGGGFCSSSVQMLRSQYRTTFNNSYLPNSNFIAYSVVLVPGFPIDKLKINNDYSYLYMAPFSEYLDYRVKAYNRTDEQWKDIYEQGRLSMFPYIKNLKTGDINYFNKKLTTLQKDKKTPII
ncbi:hypothetical protein C0W38_17475 [Photobacterium angustum]|uniref:hypothetical protein n=1 Tax=Photobacterium angustum TaxID=661 RepID=UPI000D15B7AD|nr:hypothetical protein [Photobacterium angustum]PSW96291.1 hypothetical protein C0W79_09650 [Photobacterium angustum]PSX02215.1 hypothetical protein C0W87_11295 [Photobacterium angustum]PSX32851.1 hypothetical protein C0W38_17475 [Photobacterium angustum]